MSRATEYCNNVFDGTHDSPKPCKTGHKLLTSKNIMNGYIDKTDSYYISDEDYNAINKRSQVKQWDILFSMIGTVGNVCIITDKEIDFAIKNMGVFSCKNEYEAKWLYFYLQSNYVKRVIQNYLNGAVQKFLPLGKLRDFEIPDFDESKKQIVDLLWNIETKIRNNEKIITELESMAKTIYDYWFLQYEFPNEEGKPYKSSGGKMVFNEELKKEIPEGWKVEKLEDMLEILKDGTHNPPKRIEHGIPLLTGTMFGKNFLDYKEATYISKDDYEKIHATYAPKENDLIITKIGTLGNVNYLTKEDIPLAIHCNSALLRFKKQYKNVFPFLLLKSDEFQLRMKALRGKSIQEFISLNKLGSIVCLIPDTHKIERFENYLNGIFEKMKAIRKEDEELTKLRDELLPLLMNGQVSFKN